MSFGLKNADATYQMLMDYIFQYKIGTTLKYMLMIFEIVEELCQI